MNRTQYAHVCMDCFETRYNSDNGAYDRCGTCRYNNNRGTNHPMWKGGKSTYKERKNRNAKIARHKKRPLVRVMHGLSRTKQYRAIYNLQRRYRVKVAGKMTMELLQRVYENNIKECGTLTCVYCMKSLNFGEDTIDHVIPVKKQGKNEYGNLVVSCKACNCMKNARTPDEVIHIKR